MIDKATEEKYWELLEEVDRTFDTWYSTKTESKYQDYVNAQNRFSDFCISTLSKLMEDNTDVLKRLKNA